MNESFHSNEDASRIGDDELVQALKPESDASELEKLGLWMDGMQKDIESVAERNPDQVFSLQVKYSAVIGIIYFKAGLHAEAIGVLEEAQMGVQDEDRLSKALDIMRIADEKKAQDVESALNEILAELRKEIDDIIEM